MTATDLMLVGMVMLFVVGVIVRIREERQARLLGRQVALVLKVLIVWADTWGQPVDAVKAELAKALHGRRSTDR